MKLLCQKKKNTYGRPSFTSVKIRIRWVPWRYWHHIDTIWCQYWENVFVGECLKHWKKNLFLKHFVCCFNYVLSFDLVRWFLWKEPMVKYQNLLDWYLLSQKKWKIGNTHCQNSAVIKKCFGRDAYHYFSRKCDDLIFTVLALVSPEPLTQIVRQGSTYRVNILFC